MPANPVDEAVSKVQQVARTQARAYSGGEDRPLGAFVGLMGAYAASVAVGTAVVRRRGDSPARPSLADVALIAAATLKLSRLLAKDPVTSPLRAPFVRFEGTSGPAELREAVRGRGARKAIGELVTCPFCMSQWVATGFIFGFILIPRAARAAAVVFTGLAAADFLQLAHAKAEQSAR